MSLFHRVMTKEFQIQLLCKFGTSIGLAVWEILVFLENGALKLKFENSTSVPLFWAMVLTLIETLKLKFAIISSELQAQTFVV